jgi:hypothetical protein
MSDRPVPLDKKCRTRSTSASYATTVGTAALSMPEPPGYWGESGEPHHHDHHQQVLLHNQRPKEGAPHVDPDQPGVTERAPELAGD